MSSNKYYSFLLMLLLFSTIAKAQFLDYGTDPLRYRWNQVDLPHYKLIYPRGLDSLALVYAQELESSYTVAGLSLGMNRTVRFPVVLHPANTVANGMVAWTPRRMELLATPSMKQYAERWERHLVVHESRHAFQTYKLTSGWFRPLYFLFGEQSAGFSAAFVPKWFFEGDAVVTETALSQTGRGRLPEFQMIYRAQMLNNSFYSFDKWQFGSYRDNTGSFYTLGYNLASYARYRYGVDIWAKTLDRYVNHPVSFPTFSNAFRKNSGAGFNQLFKETFDFMRSEWAAQDTASVAPDYISPNVRSFTSYQYPQPMNDSLVIALKSSMSDINSIVALDREGKERRLAYIGPINGRLNLHDNRVYWTENVQSLRWSLEVYSVIKYLDLADGRIGTLNPDLRRVGHIAIGGDIMTATTVTEDGQSLIGFLDLTNKGELIDGKTIVNDGFVKETAWGDDGRLFVSMISDDGLRIESVDTATFERKLVIDCTRANISSLAFDSGRLYFESGMNGINNIYCKDIKSDSLYRLTSSRFGAFQPVVINSDGNASLVFADYSPKGYRIATQALDSLEWLPASFEHLYKYKIADRLTEQEGTSIPQPGEQPFDFAPRPYRKMAHLFNVHSWAPVYYNVKDIMSGSPENFLLALRPGASIISQNALNTAVTQAGWYYDGNNHHAALNFAYSGLLPVINLNLNYGGPSYDLMWKHDEENKISVYNVANGRTNLTIDAQAYIPFNFSRNHYLRGVRPSLTYQIAGDRYLQYPNRRLPYSQSLLSELLIYSYRRMATQEILPRWGFQLRLQHLTMPFNPNTAGELYAVRLASYFPGIVRPHSLMLRLGYQYQHLDGKMFYAFKQLLDAPRGHPYINAARNQATLKADYAFPILMPDLSISSLAYIKRIRFNLFYDLALSQSASDDKWRNQQSTGIDLIFDWNALRFYFPMAHGIRLTHRLGEDSPFGLELISSISF